ncbi:Na+/H+ antiporter family protein [Evansella cellulosilytica]|uniref:Na+/H+ antiporter NhaC-like protein n=1 Tax=Evansella cellulosilytica (strain ATCC 21833 / DSM 2522 / FERM P-1141 / JCM 9156 / N-4) TaxID=649639 RepID=E6U2C3_EVAC2|nr:Na+/H+ antiporter NhaC family protein [Evansella cellulosilytica]ADU31636.1 Na+/H+ antiporter NhaC-like protein [Evansella cellulosilytica DSM 2522]
MNAVLIAVFVMILLSLLRVHVVVAMVTGAIVGGIVAGIPFTETLDVFASGLGSGARIALSYAMLGAFAVAISYTGIPNLLVKLALMIVGKEGDTLTRKLGKVLILIIILFVSISSQNLVPIHIAFIPILIPPLLKVFNALYIDRRAIATIMTFGLKAPYILLPFGFGFMFHEIIQNNMADSGMTIDMSMIPTALVIPVIGMVLGLGLAVFVTYRGKRIYENKPIGQEEKNELDLSYSVSSVIIGFVSIISVLILQYVIQDMIFSALIGIAILYIYFGLLHLKGKLQLSKSEELLTNGMKLMAYIGFVMIAAAGFAEVIRETGHIDSLVMTISTWLDGNKALAAAMMLLVGLLITMGIGSSFSTIPIIAVIFVPLAEAIGFSALATIALIGTAGALGDAGSPASDSTLGPTAGLNVDGQHHHIWDTCVPTFIHLNVPLLIFGWIAAMVL